MTSERYQRLKQLLQEALELSRDQRQDFLDRACADDPQLRAELETLLAEESDASLEELDLEHALQAVANASTVAYRRQGAQDTIAANEPPMPVEGDSPFPRIPGYEILGELGRGAMGRVYKARQISANRLVALKVILSGQLAEPDELIRFRREAESLGRLNHPNIVQVYDVGQWQPPDGSPPLPFFTMELVEGGTLARRLTHTAQPARDAARLAETLARAVHAAHRQGIIHRDLKPGNILLASAAPAPSSAANDTEPADADHGLRTTDYGQPKVSDFGLAKLLDASQDLTQGNAALGTPQYMAPEQAGKAREVGPAADVYALGVILYEMLTGRPPFVIGSPKPNLAEILAFFDVVRKQEPVSPARLAAKIPYDLETICLRCLAKEPHKRYATAEALADDLRGFLNNEPIQARRTPLWERTVMWARRRPTAAGLIIVLFLSSVLSLCLSIWALGERDDAIVSRKKADDNRKKAEGETEKAKEEKRRAARHFLTLLYDQAHQRCTQEDAGRGGMLLLAQALVEAKRAGISDMDESIRTQLAAWSAEVHPLTAMFPHEGAVTAIAFSLDGRIALTGSADKTARLWDALTGKPLGPALQHPMPVTSVSFIADGKMVLTESSLAGSGRGTVARLLDAATGKALGPPAWELEKFYSAAYSPDGSTALTVGLDKTVQFWEALEGKPRSSPVQYASLIRAVAFSPNGKTALTWSEDVQLPWSTAQLWDAIRGLPLGPPWRKVGSLAFNPDGKTVLIGDDQGLRLWNGATGQPLGSFLHRPGEVASAVFSPDGKILLTVTQDQTARLWDAATATLIGSPLQKVVSGEFSADGKTVKTWDLQGATQLWETHTAKSLGAPLQQPEVDKTKPQWPPGMGKTPPGLPPPGGLGDFPFGPGGQTDVGKGPPGPPPPTRLGGLPFTGKTLASLLQGYLAVSSPDGKTMLTGGDRTARLWTLRKDGAVRSLPPHQAHFVSAAFSRDGQVVLTGSRSLGPNQDGECRLWRTATGKPLGLLLPHQGLLEAVLSPDGQVVLTRDLKTARLWQAISGKPIGPPLQHEDTITSALFSPDGKRVLTGGSGGAQLWETATAKLLASLVHRPGQITPALFSPDGKLLVTASGSFGPVGQGKGGEARLWEAATGKPIGPALQHEGAVTSVVFSPDGKTLMTASGSFGPFAQGKGGEVRLWEAATGKSLSVLQHQNPITTAFFSADSKRLLTCDMITGRLWDVGTGQLVGPPMEHRMASNLPELDGKPIEQKQFSRPGATLASLGRGMLFGDPFPGMPRQPGITSAILSPDGKRVLTESFDKTAQLWDSAGQACKPLGLPVLSQGFPNCVFSPDGEIALIAGRDHTVRLLRSATGEPVGFPLQHQSQVMGAIVSPNSRLVVTCDLRAIYLWEATTGRQLGPSLPLEEGEAGSMMAFSADSMTLLMRGFKTVRLVPMPKPLQGSPERILLWTEVITGMELDGLGGFRLLDEKTWNERRAQLDKLGGPPVPWDSKVPDAKKDLKPIPPSKDQQEPELDPARWLTKGRELLKQEGYEEAEKCYREGIKILEEYRKGTPPVGEAWNELGILLRTTKKNKEAEIAYGQALSVFEELKERAPQEAAHRWRLSTVQHNLALIYRDNNDLQKARDTLTKAVENQDLAVKGDPFNFSYRKHLRSRYSLLLDILLRLGDHAQVAKTAADMCAEPPKSKEKVPSPPSPPILKNWQDYYLGAVVTARCIPLAEKPGAPDEDNARALAQKYGDQAMALLLKAIEQDFQTYFHTYLLLGVDPALSSLRNREDFHKLLHDKLPIDWSKVRSRNGLLTSKDPFDKVHKTSRCSVHVLELDAAYRYEFDLMSRDFDKYTSCVLRIEDASGKALADWSGAHHSRLLFTPPNTGKYSVIVTSSQGGQTGAYTLAIQQFFDHTTVLKRARDLAKEKRHDEAEKVYRETIKTVEKRGKDAPELVAIWSELGNFLKSVSKLEEAEHSYLEALKLLEDSKAKAASDVSRRARLATVQFNLALVLRERGELHKASDILKQAIVNQRAVSDPVSLLQRKLLRDRYSLLFQILLRLSDHADAARTAAEMSAAATAPADKVSPAFAWKDDYLAALVTVRCIALAEKDEKLSPGKQQEAIKEYGDRAVTFLRRAMDKGLKHHHVLIAVDAELAPLRKRKDLQALLQDKIPNWSILTAINAVLTAEDPFDKFSKISRWKAHPVELEKGKRYQIDLMSREIDVHTSLALRIEDPSGKPVSFRSGAEHAPLLFSPRSAGQFRLIVTSPQTGAYALAIQEVDELAELAGGKALLVRKDRLAETDPKDRVLSQSPHKVHEVKLPSGKTYLVELWRADETARFAPSLRLEDASGKEQARDDNKSRRGRADMRFTSMKDDTYRIIVTTQEGTGEYFLRVTEETSQPGLDVFAGTGVYRVDGRLTKSDPKDRVRQGSFHQVYTLKLTAGRKYTIHLASNQFDAYLRLEDGKEAQLAQDDDSGGGLNSQIVYQPTQTGLYRIIATSLGAGSTGDFTLTVRQE